jgi:hypothetical protein
MTARSGQRRRNLNQDLFGKGVLYKTGGESKERGSMNYFTADTIKDKASTDEGLINISLMTERARELFK